MSVSSLPSLTIVVPNYNHGHVIGEQLDAIFTQSIAPAKVLVVDDASTDDSISIIQRLLSGRPSAELVRRQTNAGVCRAMNEALQRTTTECVAFLAADDLILPGLVEKSLTMLARYPEAALCSAVAVVQHHSGTTIVPDRAQRPASSAAFLDPERVRALLLKREPWFMGNTVILRREPLVAAGGFPPELMSYSDGFMYGVLALRHGACFIPESLGIWRRADSGYATSVQSDGEMLEKILVASNKRMRVDFPDLFPANLVARSNARLLFHVLRARFGAVEAHARALVGAVQPVQGARSALLAVRCFGKALSLLLFCVLRSRDIPRAVLSRLRPKRPPRA